MPVPDRLRYISSFDGFLSAIQFSPIEIERLMKINFDNIYRKNIDGLVCRKEYSKALKFMNRIKHPMLMDSTSLAFIEFKLGRVEYAKEIVLDLLPPESQRTDDPAKMSDMEIFYYLLNSKLDYPEIPTLYGVCVCN
jgi:hypothetical protein